MSMKTKRRRWAWKRNPWTKRYVSEQRWIKNKWLKLARQLKKFPNDINAEKLLAIFKINSWQDYIKKARTFKAKA